MNNDYKYRRLLRETRNWSEVMDTRGEDNVSDNPTGRIVALVFVTVLMIGVGLIALTGRGI